MRPSSENESFRAVYSIMDKQCVGFFQMKDFGPPFKYNMVSAALSSKCLIKPSHNYAVGRIPEHNAILLFRTCQWAISKMHPSAWQYTM